MCASTVDCNNRQDSQDSACEDMMKMALFLTLAIYHLHFVRGTDEGS